MDELQDYGAGIYLEMLNSASRKLFEHYPSKVGLEILLNAKSRFEEEFKKEMIVSKEGEVSIPEAGKETRDYILELFMSLVYVYEQTYGIDDVWFILTPLLKEEYLKNEAFIREGGLELPLCKHSMKYMLSNKIFGFNTVQTSPDQWISGNALLTSKRLFFPLQGGHFHIPVDFKSKLLSLLTTGHLPQPPSRLEVAIASMISLGRDVYVGIGEDKRKVYGPYWAIDYRGEDNRVSSIILAGGGKALQEFKEAVIFARKKFRELSALEQRVLLLLDRRASKNYICNSCNLNEKGFEKVMERLKLVGCINERGELTSYGMSVVSSIPTYYSTHSYI